MANLNDLLGTLQHDYDATEGPYLANPEALAQHKQPLPRGNQLAIFKPELLNLVMELQRRTIPEEDF